MLVERPTVPVPRRGDRRLPAMWTWRRRARGAKRGRAPTPCGCDANLPTAGYQLRPAAESARGAASAHTPRGPRWLDARRCRLRQCGQALPAAQLQRAMLARGELADRRSRPAALGALRCGKTRRGARAQEGGKTSTPSGPGAPREMPHALRPSTRPSRTDLAACSTRCIGCAAVAVCGARTDRHTAAGAALFPRGAARFERGAGHARSLSGRMPASRSGVRRRDRAPCLRIAIAAHGDSTRRIDATAASDSQWPAPSWMPGK